MKTSARAALGATLRCFRATVFLLFLATVSTPGPIRAEESDPPTNEYIGAAACLTCHEALHPGSTAAYKKTIHAKVFTEGNALNAQMKLGCEGCHGPGGEHMRAGGGKGMDNIIAFAGGSPDAIRSDNERCLGCHAGGERLYWQGSIHDNRDVGCASCHTVMRNVSSRNQLAKGEVIDTCGGCHRVQKARQFRSAHMPVRGKEHGEGRMDCSTCHNPHGTIADSLISRHTINENCYQCHTDKRGPFLWEHEPVRENCLNCHDPHGTTRDKMLKLGLPRLCQSCHIEIRHPSDPQDPTGQYVRGGSCLNCHPAVHGTNHPSGNRYTR